MTHTRLKLTPLEQANIRDKDIELRIAKFKTNKQIDNIRGTAIAELRATNTKRF